MDEILRMDNSLVSIVLPTYNGSKYVAEAIESCISQTYPFWELIIVDDNSSDGTPEIILNYANADPRISVRRHTRNLKLPAALNSGFAHAAGEYLTWTSDDNLYRRCALEEMVRFLEARPKVDIVYSDFSIIDESSAEFEERTVKEPEKLLFGCIVGPSFLYRRKVHEWVGQYSEDLFLAEDYDFWLRASKYFRIAPLHLNLYCYRKHAMSLTERYKGIQVLQSILKTKEQHIRYIQWVSNREKAEAFIYMAKQASGISWLRSIKYYFLAVQLSPAILVRSIRHLSRLLMES